MAIELNRDNYESETAQVELPVLVDFWGVQCVPCMALKPAVEQLEKDYEGKLKVATVNAPENRMLCAKLRVMSMPTFILYKDGAESKRLTGEEITPNEIRTAVEEVLS